MTPQEKEIQELRRKVRLLQRKNQELEHMHQLDMSEIMYQRRQIDFLMETGENGGRQWLNTSTARRQ